MPIQTITAFNFRCFRSLSLSCSDGINWFYGDNAIGKTSILELIYFALNGRSFRVRDNKSLIADYCDDMVIELSSAKNDLRLWRHRQGSLTVKLDGSDITRWSEVVEIFPVLFMDTHTHRKFAEDVDVRRKWFEWLVFHVKPSYRKEVTNYRKAMDQRMVSLKLGYDPLAWEMEMFQRAQIINEMRLEVFAVISDYWRSCEHELAIDLFYDKGYDGDDLLSLWKNSRDLDLRRKMTSYGPHKFDIECLYMNNNYSHRLSLGQQKILVMDLMLMLVCVLFEKYKTKAIWLMDDISSELDDSHCNYVLFILNTMKVQSFITSLDKAWSGSGIAASDVSFLGERNGC